MKNKPVPQIVIRNYQAEDFYEIIRIWEETGLTSPERNDDQEVIDKTIRAGGAILVMEISDRPEIIGTAWITNNARRLYLHHFGIKPAYQGMGLGYQLGIRCLEFAREQKMQIKLEVHQTNTAAIHLYQKLGFTSLDGYEVYIIRNP